MNINSSLNSATQLSTALLSKTKNTNTLPASQSANANAIAKPASEVSLSKQSLVLSQLDSQNSISKADKQLLTEIFSGVKEQLEYSKEAGENGSEKIQKAGAEFYKVAQQIEKEAAGNQLNEQQIERLAKADDAFHSVVDKAFGNPPGGAISPDGAVVQVQQGNGTASTSSGSGSSAEVSGGGTSSAKSKKSSFHPADENRDGKVSTQEFIKAGTEKQINVYKEVANNFVKGMQFQPLNLAAGQ